MAKRWKCARCSTENEEGVLTCSNCRMIRGAVVVPGSFSQPLEPPVSGWQPAGERQATSKSGELPNTLWDPAAPVAGPIASTPLWRRIPLPFVMIAVIVTIGGIGWFLNASRSPSGEITRRGDLKATDLRVGDCFDLKDPGADEIDKVIAVPCTEEHEYETFYAGAMPDGAFPTEDSFDAFVEDKCGEAFGEYIGKPYADSELDVFYLSPSEDGWEAGDRSIQCTVYHPRIHRLSESLKGSAQ